MTELRTVVPTVELRGAGIADELHPVWPDAKEMVSAAVRAEAPIAPTGPFKSAIMRAAFSEPGYWPEV